MNCQEFRARWMHDEDETTLSHIETCDDCLHWIEAAFATDEEVRFMKEFPEPSAELEDKIMLAIYGSAGQGSAAPPLSAAKHADHLSPAHRWIWRRFRPYTWVGAAGILLMLGLVTVQALHGNLEAPILEERSGNRFQESEAAPKAAQQQADLATATGESADKPVQQSKDQTAPTAIAKQAAPPSPKDGIGREAAAGNEQKSDAAAEAGIPMTPSEQPAHDRTTTSSRSAAPSDVPMSMAAPTEEVAISLDEANGQKRDKEFTMAAREEQGVAFMQKNAAALEQAEPNTGEPDTLPTGEKPMTISTFTDAGSASDVSDIPVPVLRNLPKGFSLKTVSLQYKSEISKEVVAVHVTYQRNDDFIRVESMRNDQNKRSLSIPGIFTDRRLFPIGNDQAIGVTYDSHVTNQPVEHAVHLSTSQNGIPLYVILTSKGTSLDELIRMAKEITWQ